MKVLIVEDEPLHLLRVKKMVEQSGHTALCASTGESAYNIAMAERPGMAIIKTTLPDIRGMELFYRIRIHPVLRDMLVMLTNPHFTDEETFQGFSLSSDFQLPHPLDARELTNILERMFPGNDLPDPTQLSDRFQGRDFSSLRPQQFMEPLEKP